MYVCMYKHILYTHQNQSIYHNLSISIYVCNYIYNMFIHKYNPNMFQIGSVQNFKPTSHRCCAYCVVSTKPSDVATPERCNLQGGVLDFYEMDVWWIPTITIMLV